MAAIAAFVRTWFREPAPPFELRAPSARWGQPGPRQARHTLRVAGVIEETPSTRTFVLASPDGSAPPFRYRAGQHLTLLVDVGGTTQRRCYSFSTAPDAGSLPAITVKRVAQGVVSRHLHESVRTGDIVTALDPSGDFTIDADPAAHRHVALVAGGVGITPLVSLAESTLRAELDSRVTLLCGHRSAEEIIFRGRLDALAREFAPRLAVRYALDAPPAGWDGIRGPLDGEAVLAALGERPVDAWYVCGPEPMMRSVCGALEQAGVPRERVRTERFAYASAASVRIPDHPAAITFAASGRTVRARAGQTLLQAGLEAGVALPSSCTMGGCGACKLRTSAGSVVMSEPNCLSEAEREAGYVLACCAYAATDLVIENH